MTLPSLTMPYIIISSHLFSSLASPSFINFLTYPQSHTHPPFLPPSPTHPPIYNPLPLPPYTYRGRIAVSLSIVPKAEIESRPVGTGRDEPNINPFLPPPFGRMSLYVPYTLLMRTNCFLDIYYYYYSY
jgi:hypothetical protein